jgi:hypothetical protein
MSWRGLIALVDLAYQGFGHGLDENRGGVRLHALRLPQLLARSPDGGPRAGGRGTPRQTSLNDSGYPLLE